MIDRINDRLVVGARTMGKILGRSERTVRRMVAAGRLRVVKLNGENSPFVCRRSELERLLTGETED